MDYRDKVLEIVQSRGPLLPVDVRKDTGLEVMMASAVLSELISSGKLKLSFLKVGGSPLYYAEGQEEKLGEFAVRLQEPEKTAFEILKSNKFLKDSLQQPAIRVALRQIKDFSKQMSINNEIYWRWYLLDEESAKKLILGIKGEHKAEVIKAIKEQAPEQKVEVVLKEPSKETKIEIRTQQPQNITAQAETKKEEQKEDQIEQLKEQSKEEDEEPNIFVQFHSKKKEPITPIEKIEKPKEESTQIKKLAANELRQEESVAGETKEKLEKENKEIRKETKPLIEPRKPRASKPKIDKSKDETDKFLEQVKVYFVANSIDLIDFTIIKKNSEIDLIIKLPTPVGKISYYCKAKNKKKCNEGDLSSAYVRGESKKLPVLFITNGELTKKTNEALQTEFKTIAVKKI